jgi:hypothetical protein
VILPPERFDTNSSFICFNVFSVFSSITFSPSTQPVNTSVWSQVGTRSKLPVCRSEIPFPVDPFPNLLTFPPDTKGTQKEIHVFGEAVDTNASSDPSLIHCFPASDVSCRKSARIVSSASHLSSTLRARLFWLLLSNVGCRMFEVAGTSSLPVVPFVFISSWVDWRWW